MKIIFNDKLFKDYSDLIVCTLDIVIYKIKHKNLNKDDYDMIIEHLNYYKNLLIEAQNNGNNS